MTQILVVGEDELCCALGERLVQGCLPKWRLAGPSISTNGVSQLRKSLPRYAEFARNLHPVLCIADTDGICALEVLHALLPNSANRLLLRLAVPEAESWAMADSEGFASTMKVPSGKVPREPDGIVDAKAAVLTLARRSKSRIIRTEVVSAFDPARKGPGYNLHLRRFIQQGWTMDAAAARSPSLRRAVQRVLALSSGA